MRRPSARRSISARARSTSGSSGMVRVPPRARCSDVTASRAMGKRSLADRWDRLAAHERVIGAGVAAIAAVLLAHAVNSATVDGRFLHVDMEQNLPTWARTLLYAAAAAA